jgi:hypothetical protein
MVCPCCLPNTCACSALRGVYLTVRVTVEPFSATASFPSCPESVSNSTFSTPGVTQDITVLLSSQASCEAIVFGEGFAASGTLRPFYSANSKRRVLVYASGCKLYVRIYYDGFPSQDSRINCSQNVFMQRFHFETGTNNTGETAVNDLTPGVEESRSIASSASELIGLKATHDPLTNVNCSALGNWPDLATYSFCESGGKMTVEVTSASILP